MKKPENNSHGKGANEATEAIAKKDCETAHQLLTTCIIEAIEFIGCRREQYQADRPNAN